MITYCDTIIPILSRVNYYTQHVYPLHIITTATTTTTTTIGLGHIGLRPVEEWIHIFQQHGMTYLPQHTKALRMTVDHTNINHHVNSLLFYKKAINHTHTTTSHHKTKSNQNITSRRVDNVDDDNDDYNDQPSYSIAHYNQLKQYKEKYMHELWSGLRSHLEDINRDCSALEHH